MTLHISLFLSLKNGIRRQLGAAIADHHAGVAPDTGDPVEFPRNSDARDRVVHHRCQALPDEVVYHAQDPEPPAIDQGVRDEVQGSSVYYDLVGSSSAPAAQRSFATATLPDHQAFFPVEPEQLLVIHLYPLAPQQNVQSTIAEPPTLQRQLPQAFTDLIIGRSSRRIAIRLPVQTNQRTCSAL